MEKEEEARRKRRKGRRNTGSREKGQKVGEGRGGGRKERVRNKKRTK